MNLLTWDEYEALDSAPTEADWNAVCSAIRAARNGAYPPDWWVRVALSGLMRRKADEFGAA